MALKLVTDENLLHQLNDDEEQLQPKKNLRLVTDENVLNQLNNENESLGKSLGYAIPRIAKDLGDTIFERLKKVPQYIEKGKTEIPGLLDAMIDPNKRQHLIGQGYAGVAEGGQGIFNTPHDIANYATNRLHLFPEDWNKKVQMARMPEDTGEMINQAFGEPKYPGEELFRALNAHQTGIAGIGGLAKTLNPMKLTSNNIARDVLRKEKENMEKYSGSSGEYNQLQKKANKRGITGDKINPNQNDISILQKDMPEKEYVAIDTLLNDKNLVNAQKAISQLGYRERVLEGKADRGHVLSDPEKDLLKSVKNTKNHIQENMFKDSSGKIHQDLIREHKDIQKGYATEVIPYTKNKSIQKYKIGKKLADELVPLLMRGDFPAQVGKAHKPLMFRRKVGNNPKMSALIGGLGIGTPLGLALYKHFTGGNNEP